MHSMIIKGRNTGSGICWLFIISLIIFSAYISCQQQKVLDFTDLRGNYFGQIPPGNTPEPFMFGLVSTLDVEYCISFMDQGRVCVFGRSDIGINYTYIKDGRWTNPQKMQLDPQLWEWKHNTGPDDKTLYFMSRGLTDIKDSKEEVNIYKMEWTGSGWTKRKMLPYPPNSTDYHEVYPSVTEDGTVYFHGGDFRNAPVIHQDIYCSRCVNGIYQEQERLDQPINTEYGEYDAFAAPDESYLIFGSDRPGGFGRHDSYICFKKGDGTWTHPANLGSPLNSISWENRVSVTPDGRYMFFVSGRNHEYLNDELENGKWTSTTGFYWVKTDFIDEMRLRMLNTECASDIVASEYYENGINAAIDKLSELSNYRDRYHFLPYEFLMLCDRMIVDGGIADADMLYQSLLQTQEDCYRIQRGYGIICIMHELTKKGLDLLKNAMINDPVEFIVLLFDLGSDLLSQSRLEAALQVMQFSMQEYPDHYLSHFGLAKIYERLGQFEKALESCKNVSMINPEYEPAREMIIELENKLIINYLNVFFPSSFGPFLSHALTND